jgi:hypothetical protein
MISVYFTVLMHFSFPHLLMKSPLKIEFMQFKDVKTSNVINRLYKLLKLYSSYNYVNITKEEYLEAIKRRRSYARTLKSRLKKLYSFVFCCLPFLYDNPVSLILFLALYFWSCILCSLYFIKETFFEIFSKPNYYFDISNNLRDYPFTFFFGMTLPTFISFSWFLFGYTPAYFGLIPINPNTGSLIIYIYFFASVFQFVIRFFIFKSKNPDYKFHI